MRSRACGSGGWAVGGGQWAVGGGRWARADDYAASMPSKSAIRRRSHTTAHLRYPPPVSVSSPNFAAANLSQGEFDQARLELLRRRVIIFATVVGSLLILLSGLQWWLSTLVLPPRSTRPSNIGMMAGLVVGLALITLPRIRRHGYSQTTLRSLIWQTIIIVITSAVSQTVGAIVLAAGITEALRPLGFTGNLGPIFVLPIFMVVLHTAAAIIVPWTLLEACVPPAAWAGLALLASLGGNDSPNFVALGIALPLAAGLPGLAITFFRAGSLRETLGLRLIGARYAEVERELVFARRLHERLFPKPTRQGPIRLEYAYEPMRELGGDFLDVSPGTDGSLLVVVIDVTGHGVAAALAVNRLHGELKRTLAESRDTTPAAIMMALNRYIHLTLADESVFATALAARVWPDGRARLCIAGHPPPLLRAASGTVTAIEPTAAILGPFTPQDFEADEVEIRLSADFALVLYTDGAVECRNAKGKCLGQDGLERFTAAACDDEHLPHTIMREVTAYRHGASEDDVLIAVVRVIPET